MKLNFLNQHVDILVDSYVTVTQETEDGVFQNKKSLTISGYLLDFDEIWLYLGTKENVITDQIHIEKVIAVSLSEERDQYDDILDELTTPENSDGFH